MAGRRKGSTHVHEETWTTARAQKAGYTTNKKYATDPQAMLYARAAADVCRQVAPDALAGLDYAVEELEMLDAPTVTVTRTTAPATKAQRKPAAAPVEPPLEPVVSEATHTVAQLRSEPQMRKLWALAKDAGMDETTFRAYLNDALDREVESTKTITADEANSLIDWLEQSQAVDHETGEVL